MAWSNIGENGSVKNPPNVPLDAWKFYLITYQIQTAWFFFMQPSDLLSIILSD